VSLSRNLQTLLTEQKLEQKDLAKKVGVSPNTVSDWVTGKTNPRYDKLPAIAKALKTTVAELLA
jgi:transcriptional regulator with XRE-family HTH domain